MSEFSTSLRVIACFKAGEDLAERLESVVKAQGSMAMALLKAATEIERLEELRSGAVAGCETVRLTDAEREAIEWCLEMATIHATECDDELASLRSLLERLK